MHVLKKQSGFTLVEIALVLIIVSLVLAAVIKGSEMVERARVKQVVKKLDEMQAASLTYLDKYQAIPGDDADSHNGTITPAATSPGDGKIDSMSEYWQQLQDAGLINGAGGRPLITPWGTPYGALYNAAGLNDNAVCVLLPLDIAVEIDTRYDDGIGTSGSYRLAADNGGVPATTSSNAGTLGNLAWLCTRDIQKLLVGG